MKGRVKQLGGLFVIGTERHESRRIDNQLRGRSGRQGDVGASQFCVSFEDDLMVRFGTDRAKMILQSVGFAEDVSIRNKMLSNSIESAQKRVEGNNFDIRKTLLEYDNVINEQRMIIYEKRNQILDLESIHELTLSSFKNYVDDVVYAHLDEDDKLNRNDKSEILEAINDLLRNKVIFDEIEYKNSDEIIEYLSDRLITEYEDKIKEIPEETTDIIVHFFAAFAASIASA